MILYALSLDITYVTMAALFLHERNKLDCRKV